MEPIRPIVARETQTLPAGANEVAIGLITGWGKQDPACLLL